MILCMLLYVMGCATWYHLYNLKNVKYTHGEVLILVKLQRITYVSEIRYLSNKLKPHSQKLDSKIF